MTDYALNTLRYRRVRPDTLQDLNNVRDRSEKIMYCRRFFRENVFFRSLVEGTADQVNCELCVIEDSPISITSKELHRLFLEFLITGEAIWFEPTKQILRSELVDIQVRPDGVIDRLIYDNYDLDTNGVSLLRHQLVPYQSRGEPPFFVVLPWCFQASTTLNCWSRAAEMGTRLLAKVVTFGGVDSSPEFNFEDDILILRTQNMSDTIELPRYQVPEIKPILDYILRMISSVSGMPMEVLFSDFTVANFSQSKAAFMSLRNEVQRYRRMLEDFTGARIVWPEVVGTDLVDLAKAQMYESKANGGDQA